MTLYRYKALGKDGKLHRGMTEATSLQDLKGQLENSDCALVTCSSQRSMRSSFFGSKISTRAMMDFCLHLEQFEKAGVPLKESLEDLLNVQENPKLKAILIELVQDLERGLVFSKALEKHSLVFDPIFIGLVAVGEKTGHLSFGLEHLVHHLKWLDEVQDKTRKALRYPLFMVSFLMGAIFVLMTVLVPELVEFLQSFKGELPFSTRCLIATSAFFSSALWVLIGGGGIGLLLMVLLGKRTPQGNVWKIRLQAKLPLVGALRHKMVMAQFCHLFAVLFNGGVDVLQALQTIRQILEGEALASTLMGVERYVREGSSLSQAFVKSGGFPPLMIRMVRMGERTSSLQKNLMHVKEYFDTTLKRHVDHMVGLIEPILILTVGIMMAWIVYSIFVPLYETLAVMDY